MIGIFHPPPVTPLQVDLTHVNQIPLLRDWLKQ